MNVGKGLGKIGRNGKCGLRLNLTERHSNNFPGHAPPSAGKISETGRLIT